MKYEVLKDFLDRYDNGRHCRPGEPHVPPTQERAEQLIREGFIRVVPDDQPEDHQSKQAQQEQQDKSDDCQTTRKRGGRRKKDEVTAEGDPDGEASTVE